MQLRWYVRKYNMSADLIREQSKLNGWGMLETKRELESHHTSTLQYFDGKEWVNVPTVIKYFND